MKWTRVMNMENILYGTMYLNFRLRINKQRKKMSSCRNETIYLYFVFIVGAMDISRILYN